MIAGQRLSPVGWERELDKMVRWGATVTDADRATLQPFLAARFAPAPVVSHDEAPGGAVFERACLRCHDRDIVETQRLSPAGWVREVDKMVRWGAAVSEADKAPLAAYLAARFPRR